MKTVSFTRPTISKKDIVNVLEYLIEENISNNQAVHRLEKELARLLQAHQKVIATNSPATALYLILKHIGIQPGDEIILSILSEPFVMEVINFFGAIPVWIDISMETLQMNPEQITQKINNNTKAVIINHHFGYPFPPHQSSGSSRSFLHDFPHVKVIEDITAALFSKWQEKSLGTLGDYAFTGFENNRIITMEGGGAIITNTKKDAREILIMRSFKEKPSANDEEEKTWNRLDFTLSNLQAVLGLSELFAIERIILRRYQIKQFYQDSLNKGRHSFLATDENVTSNHFAFPVILHSDVNRAKTIFDKEKIEIKDIVEGTVYEHLPYDPSLKNIHQIKHKVVLIPIYPVLKKEEIEKISLLLNSI